ncbi:MAG: rubredoxin [Planctomycetaceae bacterium]|nr:rubredoxin [Planctomycetaceae bacterium]
MKKYVCDVCGWVYDPAVGAPADNVPPGTDWAKVPEDFVCPECGAGKDSFSPQD